MRLYFVLSPVQNAVCLSKLCTILCYRNSFLCTRTTQCETLYAYTRKFSSICWEGRALVIASVSSVPAKIKKPCSFCYLNPCFESKIVSFYGPPVHAQAKQCNMYVIILTRTRVMYMYGIYGTEARGHGAAWGLSAIKAMHPKGTL